MKPEQRVGAGALLAGALLVATGTALIWLPLGLIVFGVWLAAFGAAVVKGSQ